LYHNDKEIQGGHVLPAPGMANQPKKICRQRQYDLKKKRLLKIHSAA
jgi:hypothetical protein